MRQRLHLPKSTVKIENPVPLPNRTATYLEDKERRVKAIADEMYPPVKHHAIDPVSEQEFLERQDATWRHVCANRGMGHKYVKDEAWRELHDQDWRGADMGIRTFRTPGNRGAWPDTSWLSGNAIILPNDVPPPEKALGSSPERQRRADMSPPKQRVEEALWKDSFSPASRSIQKGRFVKQPDPLNVAAEWNVSPNLRSKRITPKNQLALTNEVDELRKVSRSIPQTFAIQLGLGLGDPSSKRFPLRFGSSRMAPPRFSCYIQ